MSRSTPQSRRWVIVYAGDYAKDQQPHSVDGSCGPLRRVTPGGLLAAAWGRGECLTAPERIVTVTVPGKLASMLGDGGLAAPGAVLHQPSDAGYGAGLLLGLAYVRAVDPDATVVLLPAWHQVEPEALFVDHLGRAADLADALGDRTVLLGAVPDWADEKACWIEPGGPLQDGGVCGAFEVRRLHAANGSATRHYFAGSLWDTTAAAVRAEVLWHELLMARPATTARFDALAMVLHAIHATRAPEGDDAIALSHVYRDLEPWRLDQGAGALAGDPAVVLALEGLRWICPPAAVRVVPEPVPAGLFAQLTC